MRGGVPESSSAATKVAIGRGACGLRVVGCGTSAMTGTAGGGAGIPATMVSGGGRTGAATSGGGAGKIGGGKGGRGFSGSGSALTCGICSLDSRGGGSAGCLAGWCPNSGVAFAVLDASGVVDAAAVAGAGFAAAGGGGFAAAGAGGGGAARGAVS